MEFSNVPVIKVNSFGFHLITNCYIKQPICRSKGALSYLSDKTVVENADDENCVFINITIEGASINM